MATSTPPIEDDERSTSLAGTGASRGAGNAHRVAKRLGPGAEMDLMALRVPDEVGTDIDRSGKARGIDHARPAFAFEPLGSGWYRIIVDLGNDARLCPRVYVAQAHSYSMQQSAELARLGDGGLHEARFLARLPFDSIRLDPGNGSRDVRLTSVRIRALTLRERFLGLFASSLRSAAWRPAAFVSLWKGYGVRKRARNFIDLGRFWQDPDEPSRYDAWIEHFDHDDAHDRERLARRVAALPSTPLISVVMPVHDTPRELLDQAIGSVVNQVYPNWELCIANDGSKAPHVRPQLDRWAARNARIKVVHRDTNGHICHATNAAFGLATGDWIALLDHDDMLAPNALAETALALDANPDAALVYSDEDKIDARGRRFDPHFKPDYSPELFRSMNYFNHLTVHRADLVRAVGGWRPGFEGSQDYDISLRIIERIAPSQVVHVPRILYHWRAIEGSTALAGSQKSYAYEAGFRALREHLARSGQDAQVMEIPGLPFYRVRHAIPPPPPLVSLIIPTRDRVDLVRMAVGSILDKTTYPNFEIIIVDNDSREAETFAYFEEIASHANVRVIPHPHPFNYSAINNAAVRHARGEILGLINNDIEVISPDWLTEMVSWARFDRIGCVGAKLYYPDDTIQHAGIVLGLLGVAGHSHKHMSRGANGYFGRARVLQNVSAVTGACLVVRRSVFEQVGGLDEDRFKVAFNDVDFCLRVRAAGYDNVWTPFAELYHHESPSRGKEDTPVKRARFEGEVAAMKELWARELAADPFYSPNLTTLAEDFGLAQA